MGSKVEIAYSGGKLVGVILGCVVFVIVGIFLVVIIQDFVALLVGIVVLVFFGGCAVVATVKFFKNLHQPALVIDRLGISGPMLLMPIPWKNITGLEKIQIHGQDMLIVKISNPLEYIEQIERPLFRKPLELTLSSYGSPVSLSAVTLKCSQTELEDLMFEWWEKCSGL
ncbi:MAG: hypothetical protein FWG65_07570 [Turicibacter sp.]|nr:hypothetical protein [Turicibacter sp.]